MFISNLVKDVNIVGWIMEQQKRAAKNSRCLFRVMKQKNLIVEIVYREFWTIYRFDPRNCESPGETGRVNIYESSNYFSYYS